MILLFICCRRWASAVASMSARSVSFSPSQRSCSSSSSSPNADSSSSEQIERIARSISVILAPTKGRLHVKASMKFGSQYGCEVALYCRMVMFLFLYLITAPRLWYASR